MVRYVNEGHEQILISSSFMIKSMEKAHIFNKMMGNFVFIQIV